MFILCDQRNCSTGVVLLLDAAQHAVCDAYIHHKRHFNILGVYDANKLKVSHIEEAY